MYQRCDQCNRSYDDEGQWTICPHSPLGCSVDDLCPRCDTLRSVHGPCSHQTAMDIEERRKRAGLDTNNHPVPNLIVAVPDQEKT